MDWKGTGVVPGEEGEMNTSVMFSSQTDQWATPQGFFDELNEEFHFGLDVCADETNHKCERYYDKAADGLSQEWDRTTWCNPPYGREVGAWCEKALKESMKHDVTVVMLLPARTDTKWFHDFVYGKAELRFVRGRLKYGDSQNSAPFPSMLAIFRGRTDDGKVD